MAKTLDEYFAQDITDRLTEAQMHLMGEDGFSGPQDPVVFQDECIGIYVSDVITDAIVEIRRLRKNQLILRIQRKEVE